jgi:hypothetical protein
MLSPQKGMLVEVYTTELGLSSPNRSEASLCLAALVRSTMLVRSEASLGYVTFIIISDVIVQTDVAISICGILLDFALWYGMIVCKPRPKERNMSKPNGEKVTLVGIGRIRVELIKFVVANTNDKQTEGELLNLIEELADESEKRGYEHGYHAGFYNGCQDDK